MRINPISVNSYQASVQNKLQCAGMHHSTPNFEGKHSGAKWLGGIFGTVATLGAIGGTIIMTGGVALPFVLGYGALGAASGAIIGHEIDKGAKENKDFDKQA